jgi:hypothetical protein
MPAFASIESTAVPPSRPAAPIGVYRYRSGGIGGSEYLSNVRVLAIQYREGADAGVARFRYVFDSRNPSTAPNSFQDALSVDANLPGIVANDDRLVVLTFNPDGSPEVLFDGFAQVPQLGLAPDREMVTFLAFGVAIREWDTPIGGALMRDADAPFTVSDAETDLVTYFNPQGLPNATPEGADASDDSGNTYPTFLDPHVIRDPDPRRLWTLPMAVRYLCYRHNPDQEFVKNPDGALLDALLDSRVPGQGGGYLPDDPTTYSSDPLARSRARLARAQWVRDDVSARDRSGRKPIDDPGNLPPTGWIGLDLQGSLPPASRVRLRPRPDQPRRGATRPRHERGRQCHHGRVGTGSLRGVIHPGAGLPDLPRRCRRLHGIGGLRPEWRGLFSGQSRQVSPLHLR